MESAPEQIKFEAATATAIAFTLTLIIWCFAVADGSERFPWASRDLLNRLSESLAQSGAPDTVSGWRDLINTEIYSEQKYQHKTTFSCVAIRPEGEGVSPDNFARWRQRRNGDEQRHRIDHASRPDAT